MIIKFKKVGVKYGENRVLKDVSAEILEGDFVCVVGANGSGKSTLVKAVLGLIKHSGEILYGVKREEIGYLPQETRVDDNFPATVLEIVRSGTLGRMKFKPFYGENERGLADEAMKKLGITKLRDKSFSELSGGQRQKVLLARALAATSKLLILDEPSNNLDYKSRKEFYAKLKELNEAGLSIMMITHDLDVEDLIGNKVLAIVDSEAKLKTTEKYLKEMR